MAEDVIKDTNYLYLSKVDDEDDFMIRKRDKTDPEVLISLDNDEEVKMAALVFASKMLG